MKKVLLIGSFLLLSACKNGVNFNETFVHTDTLPPSSSRDSNGATNGAALSTSEDYTLNHAVGSPLSAEVQTSADGRITVR